MSEWKKYKLGEIAELRKEQVVPNGKEQPYIGLEHIEQQSLRLNGIGSSNSVISNKFKFYSGDILYGKLRPYFRKVYKPKFDGVCSTDIYVIKNKNNVEQDFLYYLIATEEFTNIANSGSSGTRMPRADWKQLEKSEWLIPDLSTQRQIAQILSSLDDKIELNLQMNQTLEVMAQAIFKEWFVNFNCPNLDSLDFLDKQDFEKKEENGKENNQANQENPKNQGSDNLPKGWRMGKLGEVVSVQNGFAFKGGDFLDVGTNGVIKIKNISNNVVDIVNMQFVSDEVAASVDNRFKVKSGDLLIAMTGAEVGKVGFVPNNEKNLWLNQRVGSFKEKVKFAKWFAYLILSTKEYQNVLLSSASGSAQPNISASQIERVETLIPTHSLIESFGEIVNPLFEKMLENFNQIQTLTQIRDSLLPKLMSGSLNLDLHDS